MRIHIFMWISKFLWICVFPNFLRLTVFVIHIVNEWPFFVNSYLSMISQIHETYFQSCYLSKWKGNAVSRLILLCGDTNFLKNTFSVSSESWIKGWLCKIQRLQNSYPRGLRNTIGLTTSPFNWWVKNFPRRSLGCHRHFTHWFV